MHITVLYIYHYNVNNNNNTQLKSPYIFHKNTVSITVELLLTDSLNSRHLCITDHYYGPSHLHIALNV